MTGLRGLRARARGLPALAGWPDPQRAGGQPHRARGRRAEPVRAAGRRGRPRGDRPRPRRQPAAARRPGIIVNKLRAQSVEHRFRYDELRQTYGDLVLDPPLPDRAAVQQAEGACVPVQAWRSPGAREVSDALEDHLETLLTQRLGNGPLGVTTGKSGKGRE